MISSSANTCNDINTTTLVKLDSEAIITKLDHALREAKPELAMSIIADSEPLPLPAKRHSMLQLVTDSGPRQRRQVAHVQVTLRININ